MTAENDRSYSFSVLDVLLIFNSALSLLYYWFTV
jgi:hypothetical protein